MSEETKQKTQEIEHTESTEEVESIPATENENATTETNPENEEATETVETAKKEEDMQDVAAEEELDSEKDGEAQARSEKNTILPPVQIENYLDPSILNIKVVSTDELEQYDLEEVGTDNLHDQYSETFSNIREKEVVTGTVVGLTDRDVLVDIGFKSEGIIHRTEFDDLPEPGDEIDVFIQTFEDRRGNIILSKERADFKKRWKEIRDSFENEDLITGLITRRIKGGMVVDLGVVQAFLPGSQIDIKPVMDFDEFLGVESEFKIVKFNELRENIVLSRKIILEDDLLEKRQSVLKDMEIGMELEGIIKNITESKSKIIYMNLPQDDPLIREPDITKAKIRINYQGTSFTAKSNRLSAQ